jgi:hypothetical protein
MTDELALVRDFAAAFRRHAQAELNRYEAALAVCAEHEARRALHRAEMLADVCQGLLELQDEVAAEVPAAQSPPPAAHTYVVSGTLVGSPKERPRPANDRGEA